MCLVTKEVEVNITSRNVNYYEEKGYYIPKVLHHGKYVVSGETKIIVKIEDLRKTSKVPIVYRCDCCNEEYTITYECYCVNLHDGKKYCKHCCSAILNSGKNNHKWNEERHQEERIYTRQYPEYNKFIKSVLSRDNYTCQCCGYKNNNTLEVHHLNGYNWDKENRTNVTNGITLCENCHDAFHSKYGKGNNTKEQFEEWLGVVKLQLDEFNGELLSVRKIYCFEENKVYDSVKNYAYEHKVAEGSVYKVCNGINKTLHGMHIKYYDDFIKMTEEDILLYMFKKGNAHKRKVVCLETNEIFESLNNGAAKYNIKNTSNIAISCSDQKKTSGKLEDGTRLHWMYYEDYINQQVA